MCWKILQVALKLVTAGQVLEQVAAIGRRSQLTESVQRALA